MEAWKTSDAESLRSKKIKGPQCHEDGMLSIHQRLIEWLSQSGGKWLQPLSTRFKGNHADFRLDSGIADGTAIPITARFQQCFAIPMPVFELWQHGGAADTVKCKPLARVSCPD